MSPHPPTQDHNQDATPIPTLPTPTALATALASLPSSLPTTGLGDTPTLTHLHTSILPALNSQSTSSTYYGFVTGGVLPVALAADHLVSDYDQNVQVHLPDQTICTTVEDRALKMLGEAVGLWGDKVPGGKEGEEWRGRTFTTGATGSNVLGLACGRDFVVGERLQRKRMEKNGKLGLAESEENLESDSVAELGFLGACAKAGVSEIQVLTSMGHSSLYKAASVVGLGRSSVKDIGRADEPWRVDLAKLEMCMCRDGVASIVVLSAGEVNTGRYATGGLKEVKEIRRLCDQYGAWLHVDAAFGLFVRSLLDTPEFEVVRRGGEGLELADSITGDAHKCLNVPYDCGFFFTQSLPTLTSVFRNPNAAYLSSASSDGIPSPLNIGLENSRRFRALPVYAVLLSLGFSGLQDMFARQIRLARRIAAYVLQSPDYELLPHAGSYRTEEDLTRIGIIVLFRAKDENVNKELVKRINESRRMYVSPTQWEGRPAVRVAVAGWMVDLGRDAAIVQGVLEDIVKSKEGYKSTSLTG